MEIFFTIIPFIVPVLVMIELYRRYKNKDKPRKKISKLKRYWHNSYIRLIFIERGVVKFWSAIWFVPLGFSFVFGIITLYLSIFSTVFPPLPLKMMNTKQGIIESISLMRKTADALVFKNQDGTYENFSIRTNKDEMKQLENYTPGVEYPLLILLHINDVDTFK